MKTFFEYLSDLDLLARLKLLETWFSFEPSAYNRLFTDELGKISASSPEHQQAIERLKDFDFVGYIAKSVRNAGYRDQREIQERTHDCVVKLLTGGLFSNYDERRHGNLELRLKRSVGNYIRNMVEKDRNKRRFVPTVSIGQEFEPGGVTADDLPGRETRDDSEALIDGFRELVKSRIGQTGLVVLDGRLQGIEMKVIAAKPEFSRHKLKAIVQEIKALAREYGERVGDPAFLKEIDRAMDREQNTLARRRDSTARHGR